VYIPQSALPGLKEPECSFTQSACPICWPGATKRGRPALSQEERGSRKEVGKLLKKLRREKFKTQAECAHALGLTGPAMIATLESGSWYNQEVVERLIHYLR
jgi:DNA-binding XRE family transcriptional regulator